ncbi:MAG: hypothetical protein U0V48_00805 [Anaerolineales bacterium]
MMKGNRIKTEWQIGSGEPGRELAKMINASNIEMIVVGGHGQYQRL